MFLVVRAVGTSRILQCLAYSCSQLTGLLAILMPSPVSGQLGYSCRRLGYAANSGINYRLVCAADFHRPAVVRHCLVHDPNLDPVPC
jgi:hypothetical protein